MKTWWFRMKPRSIKKTIEFFPSFAKLEGKDWNEKFSDKKIVGENININLNRRAYIYDVLDEETDSNLYKLSFEDFLSGKFDVGDVESRARNDKITFEFFGFGYIDKNNVIRVTEAGTLVIENKFKPEHLLKQLLKLQFPSPIISSNFEEKAIFPLQLLLRVLEDFNELNQLEMGFLFACTDITEINKLILAISEFRRDYEKIPNKLKSDDVKSLFKKVLCKNYPNVPNKPETYLDYADAFSRALIYTGIFLTRGRGLYTKLFVPKHSQRKLELLQKEYIFSFNKEKDFDKYMAYYGNPFNVILPWDNIELRRVLVDDKFENLKKAVKNIQIDEESFGENVISEYSAKINTNNYQNLVKIDEELSDLILKLNEKSFIEYYSKTDETRREIIDKFNDIANGTEDDAALWLEVNTWKSLVAINGAHNVKRNFKIEEDLTPRSFAPGFGNTPDMELYVNGTIILPEVSLMSGVRQWEHEGSSVISHVLKFIENEEHSEKDIFGLFISKQMNVRTVWQFFILNRESWIGRNVPVVPITINQFVRILEIVYEKELNIYSLSDLIKEISHEAFESNNYNEWEDKIEEIIINLEK